jgi:hypothetical protein
VKYLPMFLFVLLPALAGAQGTARDSAIANKIRFAKDSVYCSSANPYRDRCSRAKIVLDSIMTSLRCGRAIVRDQGNLLFPWKCAPLAPPADTSVASITVDFAWRTEVYYNSPTPYWPLSGKDTVTACTLVVNSDSTKKIGWPPVRIGVVGREVPNGIINDSASLFLRSGNPLANMCGFMAHRATSLDSVPVTWKMDWFPLPDRIFRPAAAKSTP